MKKSLSKTPLYRPLLPVDLAKAVTLALPLESAAFSWDELKLLNQLEASPTVGAFAAEESEKLLAFVNLADVGEAWELIVLATHGDFQHQGIMEGLLKHIFASHCKSRKVWLEVHEANLGARNLYRKLGFKEEGRRLSYYPDGTAAILCTKESL